MTTFKTCSTCSHWKAPEPPENPLGQAFIPVGRCKALPCEGTTAPPMVMASKEGVELYTLASFGCVLHSGESNNG